MRTLPQPVETAGALEWRTPPAALELRAGEVHLWRIALAGGGIAVAPLREVLDEDELRRAARFAFEPQRRRFVVRRAALRDLLGRYLGVAPAALRFAYGEHGKPRLVWPRPAGAIGADHQFSVSHAADLALVAVARCGPVGVDLAPIDPALAIEALAPRCLSAGELEELHDLPVPLRTEAFLRAWTRKEAFLKARGEGLSRPLAEVTVSLRPGEPARLVRFESDEEDLRRWSLTHLDPAAGFVGAVAVRTPSPSYHGWRWEGPAA